MFNINPVKYVACPWTCMSIILPCFSADVPTMFKAVFVSVRSYPTNWHLFTLKAPLVINTPLLSSPKFMFKLISDTYPVNFSTLVAPSWSLFFFYQVLFHSFFELFF